MPKLSVEATFYYNAFNHLATERPVVMDGIALIPLTAIRDYTRWVGMTDEEADNFYFIIRNIDVHYVNMKRTQRSSNKT